MSKQSNPYPVRIDEDTMDAVKALAEKEGRSLNKQIELMLKQHLQYIQPKLDSFMDDFRVDPK